MAALAACWSNGELVLLLCDLRCTAMQNGTDIEPPCLRTRVKLRGGNGPVELGALSLCRSGSCHHLYDGQHPAHGWIYDTPSAKRLASGGVRFNGREVRFAEARLANANTNERVLSVRIVTSCCAVIAKNHSAKPAQTLTVAKSRLHSLTPGGWAEITVGAPLQALSEKGPAEPPNSPPAHPRPPRSTSLYRPGSQPLLSCTLQTRGLRPLPALAFLPKPRNREQ